MRIVFFGTSDFAEIVLKDLIKTNHKVVALVTQPDKPKGRNLNVVPPSTKVLALAHGIPVYQPENASSDEACAHIGSLKPDIFIVVAFGQILKKKVLSIPLKGAINIHSSVLPRYRGAAPINWAIINGDKVTGVSIIRMNDKMDEGDVITSKQSPIEESDTYITLSEKLAALGSSTVLEALKSIEEGSDNAIKQDNSKATYAPKLRKEDGLIRWDEPAIGIYNRIRGLIPWPGAYTYMGDKLLKVMIADYIDLYPDNDAEYGQIVDIVKGKGIYVKSARGVVVMKFLQLEGKKIMDFESFLRGHRLEKGFVFSKNPSKSA